MNRKVLGAGTLLSFGIVGVLYLGSFGEPNKVQLEIAERPPTSARPADSSASPMAPLSEHSASTDTSALSSAQAALPTAPDPVSATERLVLDFIQVMDRFRRGDETLTGAEMQAAENRAAQAIEHSPEARRLFAQQLAKAFHNHDTVSMFSLERSFQMSEAGVTALIDIYDAVARRGDPLAGYAIQGLDQIRANMSEGQRVRYLEMAARHFNSHQNPGDYLPAMMFMTNAVAERQELLPVHSDVVLRMIQSRHAVARTEQEQFFTAQSLYRLLPQQQRLEFANRTLTTQPTPAHIQAVLEALQSNTLPLEASLRNALYSSIAQTPLNPQQLELAGIVLGLTPTATQPRGG